MAGKLDTNNIQDWGLEEYVQYFGEKIGIFHSTEFNDIQNTVKEMSELQNQNITMDNYIKLDNINIRLKEACNTYEETYKDSKLFNRQEHRKVVNNLKNFWSDNNLDQLREKSVLDRYGEDKSITWGNLKGIPAASIQLDKSALSEENRVSGNASDRFKVEHGGKEGYFTKAEYAHTFENWFDNLFKEETHPWFQNSTNKEFLVGISGYVDGASAGLDFNIAAKVHYWKKLDEIKPENNGKKELKENLKNLLEKENGQLQRLSDYEKDFSEKKLQSKEEKDLFFENYIKNHIDDKEMQDSFIKCKEIIQPYLETKHKILDGEKAQKKMFQFHLKEAENCFNNQKPYIGYTVAKAGEIFKNSNIQEKAFKIIKQSSKAVAIEIVKLNENDEMTKRNIASSRVADLLGVGNLIARSEKMTVQMGDKKLEGCFMEKAKGVDVRNGKDDVMEQLSQVSFKNGTDSPLGKDSPFAPSFTKDACNLEILDYICAQADRHGGNMFLQLSEPDQNGKRQIIGLQGIDNDLAFSTRTKDFALKQGELEDLCFISENLANTISNLKEDQVKYAVKDLLNEGETSALWTRIQDVQNHISKNMIKLGDNEWDLEEKQKQYTDKESEEAKRFENGFNSLKDSYNLKKPRIGNQVPFTHKNGDVRSEIEASLKKYSLKKAVEQQKAERKQAEKTTEPAKDKPEKQAEKAAEPAKEQPEKQAEKQAKPAKEKPEKQVEKQAEPAKEQPEKQVEKEAKPAKEKPEKQVEKQAEPAKDSHSKRAQLKQTLGSLKRGPKIIKSKFKENATYVKQKLEHSSRNMKRRVEALKRMKESFKEVRDFVKRGGNYIPNDPKLKSMNELKSSFGIMKEAAKQNMRQQRKMDANFAAEKEERARQHLEHRKSIRNEKGEPVEDLQTAPKEKISHDKLAKEEKETAKANTTKKEATEKTSSAPANNKAVVAANRQKVNFNGLQAGSSLSSPHKAGIAGVMNHQNIKITDEMRKSFSEQHEKFRTMVKSSNGPAKK